MFLCRDEFEADFFVRINNTGGPVDVWAVAGIEEEELIAAGSGFGYFQARIPRGQVTLAGAAGAAEPVPAAPRRQRPNKQRKKKPRAEK